MSEFTALRILADEDVSHKLIKSLRSLGADIKIDLKGRALKSLFSETPTERLRGKLVILTDSDFSIK